MKYTVPEMAKAEAGRSGNTVRIIAHLATSDTEYRFCSSRCHKPTTSRFAVPSDVIQALIFRYRPAHHRRCHHANLTAERAQKGPGPGPGRLDALQLAPITTAAPGSTAYLYMHALLFSVLLPLTAPTKG